LISTVYIAFETERLDLHLAIIRHFLLHPENRAARDAFVKAKANDYSRGLDSYLRKKPDRDEIDDLLAPAMSRSYQRWLRTNLPHLVEFSENRLKQMELILRYAFFESFLLKTIGNILWEYPTRNLQNQLIYKKLAKKRVARDKRKLAGNPDAERIAWARGVVDAVDRLPFAQWKGEQAGLSTLYLWQYLRDDLGLDFGQEKMCSSLEWVRRVRNHLVHRSLELTLLNERMAEAVTHLAGFPLLLVQAASKRYPKACTEDPPDEGDDGTPGYVLAETYY